MITNKRIEKCQDLKTLRDWKATKEKTILRSQDFIAQCELRAAQVKFELRNQITMEDLDPSGQALPKGPKKRDPRAKPGNHEVRSVNYDRP